MYCPICFNDTLVLKKSGVVDLMINGKQMDAGRFLFNTEQNRPEIVVRDFTRKVEDFFKWYSTFQNQKPITELFIASSDFNCHQGCKIPILNKFDIVDILISRKEITAIISKMAKKYDLKIELKENL